MTEELKTIRSQLLAAISTIDELLLKKDNGVYNTPEAILKMVCDYYEISHDELVMVTRRGEWVKRRMIALKLLKELVPNISLKESGRLVGYRAWGTVGRHLDTIKEIVSGKTYDLYGVKRDYDAIKKRLEA